MLPNFFIIGAQKAGTTWLAKCLSEHNDVFVPEIKEIYYFDRYYEKGLSWYESYFDGWSGETAVGEGSVGYLLSSLAPGRIRDTLGTDVKLIASIRHPVDRAYSAYRMDLSRDAVPYEMDFRTYLVENVRLSKTHSLYYAQLKRYLEVFGREKMLILVYEELRKDGQKAVSTCLDFLGLDSEFVPPSLDDKVNTGIDVTILHNQIWGIRRAMHGLPPALERPLAQVGRKLLDRLPKRKRFEPLTPELRAELFDDFAPEVEQLESLLNRDLAVWRTPQRVHE